MRDSITTLINGVKAWIRGLLAGKLDKPGGGKDGDVLTKSGSVTRWQKLDIPLSYKLPVASNKTLGGVRAAKSSTAPLQRHEVTIDSNGFLEAEAGVLYAENLGSLQTYDTQRKVAVVAGRNTQYNNLAYPAVVASCYEGVNEAWVILAADGSVYNAECAGAAGTPGRTLGPITQVSAPLPPVTVADNGKILTVVDGKWVAAVAPTPQAVPEVTNNV